MKKLWSELKTRWKSEMPKFWKKVRAFALWIGSSSLSVIIANRSLELEIDETIISICSYIVAACAAFGLSSQLTTTLPDKKNENENTPQA